MPVGSSTLTTSLSVSANIDLFYLNFDLHVVQSTYTEIRYLFDNSRSCI